MKVKYTKPFTDEYGDEFRPGNVAEHAEPEALRRIALGVCEETNPEARAFRNEAGAAAAGLSAADVTAIDCVPEAPAGLAPGFATKKK